VTGAAPARTPDRLELQVVARDLEVEFAKEVHPKEAVNILVAGGRSDHEGYIR
jgi:hypothetical protein